MTTWLFEPSEGSLDLVRWRGLPWWLLPPRLADPEDQERAIFLHVVLTATTIIVVIALCFSLRFDSIDRHGGIQIVASSLALSVGGLIGIRYGYVRIVGLTYCLLITMMLIAGQPVIGVNPVLLSVSLVNMTFIVGFAVSGRAAFVLGIGMSVLVSTTMWMAADGILPPSIYSQRPLDQAIQAGAPLLLTAVLIAVGLSRLRVAAREARAGQAANLERAREGALIGDLGQHVVQMRESAAFERQVVSTIADLFEPHCIAMYRWTHDRLIVEIQEGVSTCHDELQGDVACRLSSSNPTTLDAEQLSAFGGFGEELRGVLITIPRHAERGGCLLVVTKVALVEPQIGFLRTCAGLLGAAADRTETENQLRHAQKMEAVGQLAGGVAHDFNNLLTGIIGSADLAMLELDPEHEATALMEDIIRAGQHASLLTRQLLTFSRKEKLRPEVINLRETVRELERILRRLLGDHIELRIVADDDSCLVTADRSALEQIVLNLCLNARDAVKKAGAITIEVAMEPEGSVMLAVMDDGCGMDAETIAHIFEPFFTTKGPDRGTGLGLSTVYGLVEQFDGKITVDSGPSKGTRFEVRFPRAKEADKLSEDIDVDAPSGEGEVVLLVEDHELARQTIKRTLERNDYEVIVAENGVEALDLLAEHEEVAIVVSDINMPRMRGDEFLRVLRSRQQQMPVILLSGHPAATDIVGQSIEHFDAPLLSKPVATDVLLKTIRAELTKRNSQSRVESLERRVVD